MLLLFRLVLCYIRNSADRGPTKSLDVVFVKLDEDARHLHVAEWQTSPHAFALAVQSAIDERTVAVDA
jgi:hypothetical protein